MAKRPRTAKQLANDQRMRDAAAARKAEKPELPAEFAQETSSPQTVNEVELPQTTPENVPTAPPVTGVTMSPEQFELLLSRFASMAKPDNNKIESVGIIERFPVQATFYKDPREELYDFPRFQRYGMRYNFVVDWTVTSTKYETRQGQWYAEPRFELTLKRRQLDDDGNEVVRTDKNGKPFHPRIVLGRASFFVDPPSDLVEAELAGLQDSGLSDDELRERMMFWRYALWVEEKLNPRLPEKTTQGLKEEVIGGKAYQIEEYSKPYEG